jgi:hypothetical protein
VFESENEPLRERDRPDYTGLKILGILAPVFFFFVYLGRAEMGFTVILVLGVIIYAIKIRWRLRKHAWFWATIAVILALHVPLLFVVRWPTESKVPTLAYSLPLGIADFLIILGAVGLAEKLFSKGAPPDDEEG